LSGETPAPVRIPSTPRAYAWLFGGSDDPDVYCAFQRSLIEPTNLWNVTNYDFFPYGLPKAFICHPGRIWI